MTLKNLPFFQGCGRGGSPLQVPGRSLSEAGVRRVGWCWLIGLCAMLAGFTQASGQNVNLGAASFNEGSDQLAETWYWPLPNAVTLLYDGFGELAGATRTETYSRGQRIAGVKTVRWHLETKLPGAVAPLVEDWWLAFDVANNLCVLQIVQGGNQTAFAATPQVTPPVWLPGKPAPGLKWDFLGTQLSVENVSASLHAGGALKLGVGVPGQPVRYKTYNGGIGMVQDAVSGSPRPTGSGWKAQME